MKNLLFSVFFLMLSSALWAFQPEMKTITLNDGEKVLTRLSSGRAGKNNRVCHSRDRAEYLFE